MSTVHRLLQPVKRIVVRNGHKSSYPNRTSHRLLPRIQSRRIAEYSRDVPFTIQSAPEHFQYVVIATGVLITGGSIYFLAENLLFGTAGGIVAKTCTAPLERLTTHRQASIDSRHSIGTVVSEIYREEGFTGFWRGNGLNVFRASIQKGSLFALNDFFKSILIRTQSTPPDSSSLSPILSFCCGSLAGITSTVITYPLDPVKTVNQATIHQQRWPAMSIWYSLSQSKGYLMGPWTAAVPTFIGTSIYYGVKFASFEQVLDRLNRWNEEHLLGIPTDLRTAIAGGMSGVMGNCVTYPNNCVRKRMQTAHVCDAIGMSGVMGNCV